jgi:hypothetical protein
MFNKLSALLNSLGAVLLAVGIGIVGWFLRGKLSGSGKTQVAPVVNPLPGEASAPLDVEAQKTRQEQAKELDKRYQKLYGGGLSLLLFVLIVLIPLAVPFGAMAQEPVVPQSYEELVQYYKESLSLLTEYRKLYMEAEQANAVLLKANAELRVLAEKQQSVIVQNDEKRRLSLLGGVTLAPEAVGLLFGVQLRL